MLSACIKITVFLNLILGEGVAAWQIRLGCATDEFRLFLQDWGDAAWIYLTEIKVHF